MPKDMETSESSTSFPPRRNISEIKNKLRRAEAYRQMKRDQKKAKKVEKKRKEKEAKLLGQDLPKQVPKTIESMRVYDETMVAPGDEEVEIEESVDEMASYFNRETVPKVLITTSDRPSQRTNKFCKELKKCIPNSEIYYRRGLDLKKITPQAIRQGFTDLLIVNEDQKKPNCLIISHLPDGPTARFRVSNVVFAKEIKRSGEMTGHVPEVILNNFNTRLGRMFARIFAALFPHDPQFNGRRAVTFHNQRDFIFFRQHRYQFRNAKRVGLQELGPRFTLRPRYLQKGTFDSKNGEYYWMFKRREMETSRRKFFL